MAQIRLPSTDYYAGKGLVGTSEIKQLASICDTGGHIKPAKWLIIKERPVLIILHIRCFVIVLLYCLLHYFFILKALITT